MQETVYLKCNMHSKVQESRVYIKDIAEVYCRDTHIVNKVRSACICHLKKAGDRQVMSTLFIMKKLEEQFPEVEIELMGSTDVIAEWDKPQKLEWLKIAMVSLIAFFGTAFTIMAFHNDIAIRDVFEEIYHLTRGTAPDGVDVLELSYCIGLFLGITVFFNHFGKKKLTNDPTPVTVAMYKYEQDVDQTIVENVDRQGDERNA